jgi:GH15 family glucan-1,4-alpha-glucosidase
MGRPIVLSNGTMHVGINYYGEVHDFFYPYVGLENHSMANHLRHRIGVWVEGHFSWLDSGEWTIEADYYDNTLIGLTRATNKNLGITLEFQDAVDAHENAFMRNIHIINEFNREREVRIFLHQMFLIYNSLNGDTGQYLPGEHAILHYKGRRAFVVGGQDHAGKPFTQYSVGLFDLGGDTGTYKDAEDGELARNNVEHGTVDSVIGFAERLEPHSSTRVSYWIAAAKSQQAAIDVHHRIREQGVFERMKVTHTFWQQWLVPAEKHISTMPEEMRTSVRKSLLILKSHMDKHGAVIASTDTTMKNYARDAYAYCWPRDGAFALWPLLRLGYRDELMAFFDFCRSGLHKDGYLMHKYQPDGALGSSWHPYIVGERSIAPIQEDETAVVVFLFGQYYETTGDKAVLAEFYESFIKPMANFMAGYIDETTKLPHATYDLWEEKFLTTTYSTGLTYAALLSAVKLAEEAGHPDDAVKWQNVADEMRAAAQKMLYNPDKQFFYKGYVHKSPDAKTDIMYDDVIDISSFYGAFMFGLFDLDSAEVIASAKTIEQTFRLSNQDVLPLPRYEHDQYNRVEQDSLGNPWFICTLWQAQYYLETNRAPEARKILDWVQAQMLKSGVLSEQVNPYTHAFLSVAPLAWSQAEFINTAIDLLSGPMKEIKAAENVERS